MIIAGTGHRPDKLGGYSEQVDRRLVALATAALKQYPTCNGVISGMALGWDLALAEAALSLGIHLTCAVPCLGQERMWRPPQIARWLGLQLQANVVVYTRWAPYSAKLMQVRNEWMVDRCDAVLALWNGSQGGTANCVRYAGQKHRPVRNLWASWVKYR